MTKADIADVVYERTGLSRGQAAEVVQAIMHVCREALQQGEEIAIQGFGRFAIRQKHERVGRNPKTGQAIAIPPRKVVTFKPSRLLRDVLNDEEGS